MVRSEELAKVLTEFARNLLTDFSIQNILDHLVCRIVEILPVTGAGVTLISDGMGPRFVAASDDAALSFERLQTELGQGPCLAAHESGTAVAVDDLRADTRFPDFSRRAVETGMLAVFTFPMRHDEERIGALDLYRDEPGGLDEADMEAAQVLADVAAAYLLNARARKDARETAERLRGNAMRDHLTGLPNRMLLEQRLDHAASRAQRTHHDAAVLFADLDGFKRVNDRYGHRVGDELLIAVGQRLRRLVRPGDTLSRISGDEFVILCEDLADASYVQTLATRITAALGEPFPLAGHVVRITASVGIAFAGRGEDISHRLVDDADRAMYLAKRQGGGRHETVDIRSRASSFSRLNSDREMRNAFHNGEFEVHYQPIVRSTDGLVTGVEALLRWPRPGHPPVRAKGIVAAAEQNGTIDELGAWVLDRACRTRKEWLLDNPGRLDLSVNVSASQLMSPFFAATVASVLVGAHTDPESVILEITEDVFIGDSARAVTVLSELKNLGIRIALDDFGTGYSSLEYLRRYAVDIVKIDQAFVADIGTDASGAAILEAVTKLAHVLGLGVIAEGVETSDQRDEVIAIGCESAQGYFFARPMPGADLGRVLGGDGARILLPRGLPIPA